MEIFIISAAAFFTAILTFFSGFGLGTILTPVFMIFFPVDLAIALTGVVHFFNNIFKLLLVGRKADRQVLLRFGIPAVVAAFAGAWLLLQMTDLQPLCTYQIGEKTFEVSPAKLTVSVLLILFAVIELVPWFGKLQFGRKKLPLGGVLSGFFGGLSGNQGALRSAFFNVNSGSNSAASPPKTKEERANLKNRFAIFEICSLHKSFLLPITIGTGGGHSHKTLIMSGLMP
jgi:hypothetical protein